MTDIQKQALVELSKYGDITWARFGKYDPAERFVVPPVIVWRYKELNQKIEESLINAVESFQGKYSWKIEVGGSKRNLVLAPTRIIEMKKQGGFDPQIFLAQNDPVFSRETLEELPRVIEHILKQV